MFDMFTIVFFMYSNHKPVWNTIFQSFEYLLLFQKLQLKTFKTGISNLEVHTFNGNLCDFRIDHYNKYSREERYTCTRNYEKKIEATMDVAAYSDSWWKEKTSPWPWCYYGDSWSYCKSLWFCNNSILPDR